ARFDAENDLYLFALTVPEDLLRATERDLAAIAAAVRRKRAPLRGTAEIGLAVGAVIDRRKMAKHPSPTPSSPSPAGAPRSPPRPPSTGSTSCAPACPP